MRIPVVVFAWFLSVLFIVVTGLACLPAYFSRRAKCFMELLSGVNFVCPLFFEHFFHCYITQCCRCIRIKTSAFFKKSYYNNREIFKLNNSFPDLFIFAVL